jgi:hypothetical protein
MDAEINLNVLHKNKKTMKNSIKRDTTAIKVLQTKMLKNISFLELETKKLYKLETGFKNNLNVNWNHLEPLLRKEQWCDIQKRKLIDFYSLIPYKQCLYEIRKYDRIIKSQKYDISEMNKKNLFK